MCVWGGGGGGDGERERGGRRLDDACVVACYHNRIHSVFQRLPMTSVGWSVTRTSLDLSCSSCSQEEL